MQCRAKSRKSLRDIANVFEDILQTLEKIDNKNINNGEIMKSDTLSNPDALIRKAAGP